MPSIMPDTMSSFLTYIKAPATGDTERINYPRLGIFLIKGMEWQACCRLAKDVLAILVDSQKCLSSYSALHSRSS